MSRTVKCLVCGRRMKVVKLSSARVCSEHCRKKAEKDAMQVYVISEYTCKYNAGVLCSNKSDSCCAKCGWDLCVSKRRLNTIYGIEVEYAGCEDSSLQP